LQVWLQTWPGWPPQRAVGAEHLQCAELRPLHRMAPVRRKPVIRPELLPGPGQPADVAVGAVRRGIPVLIRKQGEAMRPRNLSLPLLVSCLLAALLAATPIAQTQYVPKRPAVEPPE